MPVIPHAAAADTRAVGDTAAGSGSGGPAVTDRAREWVRPLVRLTGWLRTTGEAVGLAAIVLFLGKRADAFTGFPKGYDAMGHLSKVTFLAENWPHIWWNYEWYSGQPTFTGSYPPGYHVLLLAVARLGELSFPAAMNLVTASALVLLVIGTYAAVRAATGSRLAALCAGGLTAATPTVWSQNVVLGLYPRFTALAFAVPALACAIRFAIRGGRFAALGCCCFLAAALGTHPIVGAIGLLAVAGVVLLSPAMPIGVRFATAAGLTGVPLAMAAYFYLPLVLEKRSQSAFTDFEVPLNWRLILWPAGHSLDALLPGTLAVTLMVGMLAARLHRAPAISVSARESLGEDIIWLSSGQTVNISGRANHPELRRYLRWRRRHQLAGYPLRLAVFFALGTLPFLCYGFIGYLDRRFPYYINGLQPTDLLVYPGVCCAGVCGLAVGIAVRLTRDRIDRVRRTWRRRLARALAGAVAAATVTAAVGAAVAVTGPLLPKHVTRNDIPAQQARLAVFPVEATGQRDFRVAGVADSVTKWINEYSDAPQDRGYDDHGVLHLDWQYWLESALVKPSFTAAERDFLLDWYAVKWIDTDSGAGPTGMYDDPSRFTLLAQDTRYAVLSSYRYTRAQPIVSATRVPIVLVIGDTRHYDLFLRALSYADIGSDTLIPVQGPARIDDVSRALLAHVDTVVLYGAAVTHPKRDAALLREFVMQGGTLFADSADDRDIAKLLRTAGNPLPVRSVHNAGIRGPAWDWTGSMSGVDAAILDGFGPASYAGTNQWVVSAAISLAPWGQPVLRAQRKTVLVSGVLGAGRSVWSGLALPYHTDVFQQPAESRLLAQLLIGRPDRSKPQAAGTGGGGVRYDVVNTDHRVIDVTGPANGVLVKEQRAPDWQVTLDGRPVRSYLAGPGMMWIPLPDDGRPHHVVLTYRLSPVELAGYVIAGLTTAGVLILLCCPPLWRWGVRRLHQLVDLAARPAGHRKPVPVV